MRNKEIDLIRAISLLSFNPSKILKLNVGIVEEKKEADLSIFDISKPWKVDPENFFGKKIKKILLLMVCLSREKFNDICRGRLVYKF